MIALPRHPVATPKGEISAGGCLFLVALLALVLCSPSARAETSEPPIDEPTMEEHAPSPAPSSAFGPISPKRRDVAVDAGLGPGGFISKGGETFALLVTAHLGYRASDAWQVGLAWDGKLQPWEPGASFFHTVGPGIRWRFFEGLYTEIRVGGAFSFIRRSEFQQARFGAGGGARLGYLWMPGPVGLNAAALVNLRHIGALYTDAGATLGIQIHI